MPPEKSRTITAALLAILILTTWLRFSGVGRGLPYVWHTDGAAKAAMALEMLKTGNFDTTYFNKPTFFLYIHAGIYAVAYGLGSKLGLAPDIETVEAPRRMILGSAFAPYPSVMLIGESFAALLGVATALLLYFCARRLWGGTWTALLAVTLFMVSPANLERCQIHPDAHVTFFLTLSLYFAIGIVERGDTRDYLLTGLAIGVAASCKYNAFLFVPSIAFAHVVASHGRTSGDRIRDRRLWLGLGSIFATFVILNPYLIVHSYRFLQQLYWESRNYVVGQNESLIAGSSNFWYIERLLDTESPALLLTILALPLGLIPRTRKLLLLLSFPLTYLVVILFLRTKNLKLLALMVPFLALLAAWTALELNLKLRDLRPRIRKAAQIALWVVTALTIYLPAKNSIEMARALRGEQVFRTSAMWIEANIREGSRIAIEPNSPWIDGDRFDLVRTTRITDKSPEDYRALNVEYLAFSNRFLNFSQFAKLRGVREKNAAAIRQELVLIKSFRGRGRTHFVYAVPPAPTIPP